MAERAPILLGGRYELGPAIGSGGFATVFRARDRASNVEVAVKLVPPGFDAAESAERLQSEAAVLRRLGSRHVGKVYDVGSDDKGAWLVAELVDGVPLSVEGLGRPLFPHEVLRVARGLLEGLAVAHSAGIVHADVKPSNVLAPRTRDGLDAIKLIDFGLARVTSRAELARELGESVPASGVVLGSTRYMAPELLAGGKASARSDVYAAGLVLFELLGEGDLFMVGSSRDQLRARMTSDPELEGRVPPPLSSVLARMLARDPARRYADANEAHSAVIDLDTAPVSVVNPDDPTGSGPASLRANATQAPPHLSTAPPARPSVRSVHAPEIGAPRSARHSSMRPPPMSRLNALPDDGVDGLRETLRHFDLPMLDALARRERANSVGRIARAVALALRLELDAAALILEPLAMQSDVARAVGATVLAPRARRVTRARVDSDRDDKWIDTVPAELAGLLVAFAAALSAKDDGTRDASRCSRVLERLEKVDPGADLEKARRLDALRTTLRIAHVASRVKSGELASGTALDLVAPLDSQGDGRPRATFDRIVRALLAAAIGVRVDEGRARDELERAVRLANESGATLLEASASAAWGRLLVDVPQRVDTGLAVLERASTLLAHGDAPSLEHEAEHHRAAALIVQGRWKDAVPHLQAAREAAHAERAVDNEVLSASLEVVAHLASGHHEPAREAAAALGEARIGTAGGRPAALAWIARCLESLASGDRSAAEDAHAEAMARSREAGTDSADAYVLVEILALLFDAAKGSAPDVPGVAAELERFAAERGFTSFYWLDVLKSVVSHVIEEEARVAMQDVLARVATLLGPASRLARDRRTSIPPPPE
ncbi:MAG: protein kinase [Deltaproteobacteria bacterium]|nr:protein kinase [Deltaproteobacteria bacterium]